MEQYVLLEPYLGGGSRISTWVEFSGAESSTDAQQVRLLLEYLLQNWLTGFGSECDRVAARY